MSDEQAIEVEHERWQEGYEAAVDQVRLPPRAPLPISMPGAGGSISFPSSYTAGIMRPSVSAASGEGSYSTC